MTNKQAQIDFLAIEVLGWYQVRQHPHPSNPVWYRNSETKEWVMPVKDFDQFNNIKQAFMLLRKCERYDQGMKVSKKCWCWCIIDGNYGEFVGADNPAEVITNAVLQAAGWSDE